jgi:predicted dehydrogenase
MGLIHMNSEKIGVALIGTGFGQKVHLPALRANPNIEVVAVYHRDHTTAETIARTHNIPNACTTVQEIIDRPEVQAVTIATPPFLHYDMAKAALNAGKHILLEKPTTLNATEAQELYELATEKNLMAAMNFEFRYIPTWQRLSELLSDGYVGNVRYAKVDWLVSSRADANRPWNWYAQSDLGGGALGAIGSHAFDYITWLLGDIKRVSARLSTSILQRPDPFDNNQLKPVTADDTCNILLELGSQVPVQVCLSSVAMQGRGHFIEIYGDRGTLVLGSNNQKDYVHGFKLLGSQNNQPLQELVIPSSLEFAKTYDDGRIAPIARVVDAWVHAIQTGEPMSPSLKDGVVSQQIMDACHRSNDTDRWVTL